MIYPPFILFMDLNSVSRFFSNSRLITYFKSSSGHCGHADICFGCASSTRALHTVAPKVLPKSQFSFRVSTVRTVQTCDFLNRFNCVNPKIVVKKPQKKLLSVSLSAKWFFNSDDFTEKKSDGFQLCCILGEFDLNWNLKRFYAT